MEYSEFLKAKSIVAVSSGREVRDDELNPALFGFQRDIVRWALRKGKAAIFGDTGLGKSIMQLSWADLAGETSLILAPLAVAQQTVREAEKWGITATLCRDASDVRPGVNVANYERLHLFDPAAFDALVLDESSILKGFDGKTRRELQVFAENIPYRLACTATPAPNDWLELANHAEFLGVMRGKEIVALFFTQDGNTTHTYRLKGHAKGDFWKWLSSWAVAIRKPSDLGYDDGGYNLPPLNIHQVTVESEGATDGALFAMEAGGLAERQRARKDSLGVRVSKAANLVNSEPDEPWIVWCDHNAESEALAKAIPGAVEVKGSDSPEHKERAMLDFAEGRVRVLISKPQICGFGMNWQHCARVVFVGLSDSFERFYQAVRRCWRFGQVRPVECYVVTSDREGAVVRNIQRKEAQAREMMDNLINEMGGQVLSDDQTPTSRNEMAYTTGDVAKGRKWTLHYGDSIETIDRIETGSVGFSIFSPPFPGMYAYTNSARDVGNSRTMDELIAHFSHLVMPDKLLRVMMPGRCVAVHLTQMPSFQTQGGDGGLEDFRGETVRMFKAQGWIFAAEVTIDKDPRVKASRTKEQGLLYKTLATDSTKNRPCMADYLLIFRAPGVNQEPVRAGISAKYGNPDGWITDIEWNEWAGPVWYRAYPGLPGGIRETEVLNVSQARETDDERHLCPLQLGVIERGIKLWSNPGDLVYSPFTGIGSEGYQAIRLGRRFVGGELKRSYFETACRYLGRAEVEASQVSLFSLAPEGAA